MCGFSASADHTHQIHKIAQCKHNIQCVNIHNVVSKVLKNLPNYGYTNIIDSVRDDFLYLTYRHTFLPDISLTE